MATPYQNIAKEALMNWNGLSEEEANNKINIETVQELESQVFAMGSIKYAVEGIAQQLNLSSEESEEFLNAVVNGPENAEIFEKVSLNARSFSPNNVLNVLSTIHDGWVVDNSSEKTFNKKVDRQQLRQYAPLELIGWNEAKSDLLFLNPILTSIGLTVDENVLEDAYLVRVSDYLEEKNISSHEDLANLVEQGKGYYPVIPQELDERLLPMSETVFSQIMDNWNEKNPKIAQILTDRSNNMQL